MIPEHVLWRIREKEVSPQKVRCSTEKFVDGLQPYLDQDGLSVEVGKTHFHTAEEAWGALLSMRRNALDVAQTELGFAKAIVVQRTKLVEALAEAYDASVTAYEAI